MGGPRPGEQKPQPARLDQAVRLVQQFRQALNLVDDDDSVFGAKLLSHAARILAQRQVNGVVQEIVDPRVLESMLNQKRLARLPGSQEKMRFLLEQSLQIHEPVDLLTAGLLAWVRQTHRQIA